MAYNMYYVPDLHYLHCPFERKASPGRQSRVVRVVVRSKELSLEALNTMTSGRKGSKRLIAPSFILVVVPGSAIATSPVILKIPSYM